MSKHMNIKFISLVKFLLTDVTSQPSAFIVWLQQMQFQSVPWPKTFWTVSTWVRLCTSVNVNMTLECMLCLKQHPTVRTFIQSSVTVYTTFKCLQVARFTVYLTFVWLQVAGLGESFVTQWTLVWFISREDSHVSVQLWRLTKRFLTHVTFVRFLSTVNSTVVSNKVT